MMVSVIKVIRSSKTVLVALRVYVPIKWKHNWMNIASTQMDTRHNSYSVAETLFTGFAFQNRLWYFYANKTSLATYINET